MPRKFLTGGSTRTPTLAMPSAFFWPVLVPSALRAPAPVNLGVKCHGRTNRRITSRCIGCLYSLGVAFDGEAQLPCWHCPRASGGRPCTTCRNSRICCDGNGGSCSTFTPTFHRSRCIRLVCALWFFGCPPGSTGILDSCAYARRNLVLSAAAALS